jgi:hypothetical protein
MSYLPIELARTIDEDRFRAAEGYHRIDKALAARQKSSGDLVQNLFRWLASVMKPEGRGATEEANYAFPLPQTPAR